MTNIKHLSLKKANIRRTCRIMRLFFLFFTLGISVCFSNSSYSQSTKISLNLKNKTVKQVFSEIEKNSEFIFFYQDDILDANRKVTIDADNETVEQILDEVLSATGNTYFISDRSIYIIKETSDNDNIVLEENIVLQQKKTINGIITDKDGVSIIGANIVEKGTTNGTVTDVNGRFSLSVDNDAVLQISYIGYISQDINTVGETTFNVVLQEDTQSLEELVVVGFGTQKKVNLTGAIGVADARVFQDRPVTNAVLSLQGAVPGLTISNTARGGELNASKSIRIRGTGTVGTGSSSDPLVLVDGMEGSLSSLNPQDIESVSVLKDASASAIYGARAAFGVILVTTKSGKSGRTNFNYNNNFRFNTPVMLPELQNSWQFVNYFNDAQYNGTNNPLYSPEYMQLVKDYFDGVSDPAVAMYVGSGDRWNGDMAYGNVDWLNEYYQKWAPAQEHNLSINGGTEKLTYYLSGNILDQDGFMRYGTEDYSRKNLTGKISAKVNDYFKIDYMTRFSRINYERPREMDDGFYSAVLRRARPVRPIYDPNGYYANDIHYIESLQSGGVYAEENDELVQQLRATFTPLKDWNIIAELNMRSNQNDMHQDQQLIYSHQARNPEVTYLSVYSRTNTEVHETSTKRTFLNPNIYSNYTKSFNDHNFTGTVGMQHESFDQRYLRAERAGILNPQQPVLDLTNGIMRVQGNENEWATTGFFGRLNYDYAGRYLAEFNARYDGSSRFRKEHRWVWSPSVSLGWNMAHEDFWQPLNQYVQVFKLRASYGQLANQNTSGFYPTYQVMETGSANGNWLIGNVRPNTSWVPAPISSLLTWEKVISRNIGLDWGAFNNRFTGSFDYFVRETRDMVGAAVELPAIFGANVPRTNNTDLETLGWELELGWRDQINDFKYGIRLNISDARTRVTRYPNYTGQLPTYPSSGPYIEGGWIGNIYGYTTIGIAQSDAEMQAHLATLPNGGQDALNPSGNPPWAAGDIMYADINGDGKVDNGSRTIHDMGDLSLLGNETPRFLTGINLDLAWKGFSLNTFWQGVLKRDYMPEAMVFWGANSGGQWWSTAFTDHMDYFRADPDHPFGLNLDSYYPRPLFNSGKNHHTQSRYIQNAAYLRLKNLQLSYTFPFSLTNKIGLQQLRIFVSGENLLTFTDLTRTMDPETAGSGAPVGGSIYPLSKVYSFGLSVNF